MLISHIVICHVINDKAFDVHAIPKGLQFFEIHCFLGLLNAAYLLFVLVLRVGYLFVQLDKLLFRRLQLLFELVVSVCLKEHFRWHFTDMNVGLFF